MLTRVLSPVGVNLGEVQKIRREIKEILEREDIDLVLCNGKPFESFEAVLPLIKINKDIKFIAYQTDDFVTAEDERYFPKIFLIRRNIQRKKRINKYINNFYRYCILESVYKKEIEYIKNKEKVKSVGIPLLINHDRELGTKEIIKSRDNNGILRMVYAGSLVKSFRPPNDCLDIILEIAKETKICFDIYHKGDCGDIINRYVKKSNGIIRNFGMVNTDTAYKAILEADFLISISNYSGDQISGKTFDYISTGTPIIHFYYYENDMNMEILKEYDLAKSIMINKKNIDRNVREIKNFIKITNGKKILYEKIKEKYINYSPDRVIYMLFDE